MQGASITQYQTVLTVWIVLWHLIPHCVYCSLASSLIFQRKELKKNRQIALPSLQIVSKIYQLIYLQETISCLTLRESMEILEHSI